MALTRHQAERITSFINEHKDIANGSSFADFPKLVKKARGFVGYAKATQDYVIANSLDRCNRILKEGKPLVKVKDNQLELPMKRGRKVKRKYTRTEKWMKSRGLVDSKTKGRMPSPYTVEELLARPNAQLQMNILKRALPMPEFTDLMRKYVRESTIGVASRYIPSVEELQAHEMYQSGSTRADIATLLGLKNEVKATMVMSRVYIYKMEQGRAQQQAA